MEKRRPKGGYYNIAMSKARRIRKISVFTLSYVNTALNQSAFRIHKCYIIKVSIEAIYKKNLSVKIHGEFR